MLGKICFWKMLFLSHVFPANIFWENGCETTRSILWPFLWLFWTILFLFWPFLAIFTICWTKRKYGHFAVCLASFRNIFFGGDSYVQKAEKICPKKGLHKSGTITTMRNACTLKKIPAAYGQLLAKLVPFCLFYFSSHKNYYHCYKHLRRNLAAMRSCITSILIAFY